MIHQLSKINLQNANCISAEYFKMFTSIINFNIIGIQHARSRTSSRPNMRLQGENQELVCKTKADKDQDQEKDNIRPRSRPILY